MFAIRLQLDSASHAAGLLCDVRSLWHAASYRVVSDSRRVALRRSRYACCRRSDREGQTG